MLAKFVSQLCVSTSIHSTLSMSHKINAMVCNVSWFPRRGVEGWSVFSENNMDGDPGTKNRITLGYVQNVQKHMLESQYSIEILYSAKVNNTQKKLVYLLVY